ncbi:MAG: hypothetical protein J6W76_04870 [Spirochaetales bacterium]|nr:hypothetical protein [Spirochaetales bacterium]
MGKKIFIIGIIDCILYFFSVGLFLITKTGIALTIWELMTILSGPIVLLILSEVSSVLAIPDIYRKAVTAFMACTCSLTAAAHIVNITVTRKLISDGVNVPTYFQIGFWPSAEMAVDYLAWGFFTGLAFLFIWMPIWNSKSNRKIKITILIDAILCLVGFFGSVFINENIWYAAPMGYGIGLVVLCAEMIFYN